MQNQRVRSRVKLELARNRHSRPVELLERAAQFILRGVESDTNDFDLNGESWLLDVMAVSGSVSTVLDVGANTGQWAMRALEKMPDATIVSFEPLPEAWRKLELNLKPYAGSRRVFEALSGESGQLELFVQPSDSSITSAYGGTDECEIVYVPATTGDHWCSLNNIRHVDFLKVDVEGHELSVLNGFLEMLRAGEIDLIQFEFNSWAPRSRTWLRDFYDLLVPLGYQIGKLAPGRVDFCGYDVNLESFRRSNRVAVSPSFDLEVLRSAPSVRTPSRFRRA